MADPFSTLGVTPDFGLDMAELEKRHRDLSRALHPDRHSGGSAGDRRHALGKAIEVNEAFRMLKDPVRRAEALLALRGIQIEEGKEPAADPMFLMDIMELREALSDVRKSRNPQALERLTSDVKSREARVTQALTIEFAKPTHNGSDAQALTQKLGELRYYRRFLDEAGVIEDELG